MGLPVCFEKCIFFFIADIMSLLSLSNWDIFLDFFALQKMLGDGVFDFGLVYWAVSE